MKAMLENKKIKRLFVFTVTLACAAIMALVGIAGYMVYGVSDDAETLYSGTSGTVSWTIYDDGTLYFYPTDGKSGTLATYTSYSSVPWYSYRSYITTIESADGISAGTSLAYLFYYCSNLADVDGLANWDTSSVTDMSSTFGYCTSLSDIDGLTNWNVSSVTDMRGLFYYCTSLTDADLSGWTTSSLVYMGYTSTSTSYAYYGIFSNCTSLETLDISGFDTSSVTARYYTFHKCDNLSSITLGENWTWGSDYTTPETGSLPDTYSWIREDDAGAAYGTLTASELATNWTSDYAGTWVWAVTITIQYDANGGSGSMNSQSVTGADSLLTNAFICAGYNFIGWNTAADGTGTSYAENATILAFDYLDENTAILYAQWSAKTTTMDDGNTTDAITIESNVDFIFTNTYDQTSDLYFTKTVIDTDGNEVNGSSTSYVMSVVFANMDPYSYFYSDIGTVTADEDGIAELAFYITAGTVITFEDIPVGVTYQFTESANSCVASYILTAEDTSNIVSLFGSNSTNQTALSTEIETANNEENVTVTFINTLVGTASSQIYKLDDNDNGLSGATFELYNSETGELIDTVVTGDDGYSSVTEELGEGSYYYIETEAPDGYYTSATKYSFTVSSSNYGEIITIIAYDSFLQYLTNTGGIGLIVVVVFTVIISIITCFIFLSKKEQEKKIND